MAMTDEQIERFIKARELNPDQAETFRRDAVLQRDFEDGKRKFQEFRARPGVQRVEDFGRGALLGGASGAALGGIPGAIKGAVGGGVGELATGESQRQGAGFATSAGIGLAADLAATGGAGRLAGGVLRRAAGEGGERLVQRTPRALRQLDTGDLRGALGEGTEDASFATSRIVAKFNIHDAAEKADWERFRKATVGGRASSRAVKRIRDVAEKINESVKFNDAANRPSAAADIAKLGDNPTVEELQGLLSGISRDVAAGSDSLLKVPGRRVGHQEMRSAVDAALNEIATTSPGNKKAVRLLRTARDTSAKKNQLFQRDGPIFKKLVSRELDTDELILAAGDTTEQAQGALARIFMDEAGSAVQNTQKLLDIVGDDVAAIRGLRRSAVNAMFARQVGGSAEDVVASAGKAAAKIGKHRKALEVLFGDGNVATGKNRVDSMLRLAKKTNDAARKGRHIPQLQVMQAAGVGDVTGAGSIGLLAGGLASGNLPATGFGLAASTVFVLDKVRQRYGPQAVRVLALDALTNPEMMANLTRSGERFINGKAIDALVQSSVRRGILTAADVVPVISGGES